MTEIISNPSTQIKPKYLAQRCPVCNGFGTVSFKRKTCHACMGLGYITIPIEREREKDYGNGEGREYCQ
ncbi:MAG: hypothetical protein MUO21_03465 [Nitrososphaeraceae archaeon]|nr:hypothetical protein [Nitrososphaeraceae archaeon]